MKNCLLFSYLFIWIYGCAGTPDLTDQIKISGWEVIKSPRAFGGPLTILYGENRIERNANECFKNRESLSPILGIEDKSALIGLPDIYKKGVFEVGLEDMLKWLPISINLKYSNVEKVAIKFGRTYVKGYSDGSIIDYLKENCTKQPLKHCVEELTSNHRLITSVIIADHIDYTFYDKNNAELEIGTVLKGFEISLNTSLKKINTYTLRLTEPTYIAYQYLCFK